MEQGIYREASGYGRLFRFAGVAVSDDFPSVLPECGSVGQLKPDGFHEMHGSRQLSGGRPLAGRCLDKYGGNHRTSYQKAGSFFGVWLYGCVGVHSFKPVGGKERKEAPDDRVVGAPFGGV